MSLRDHADFQKLSDLAGLSWLDLPKASFLVVEVEFDRLHPSVCAQLLREVSVFLLSIWAKLLHDVSTPPKFVSLQLRQLLQLPKPFSFIYFYVQLTERQLPHGPLWIPFVYVPFLFDVFTLLERRLLHELTSVLLKFFIFQHHASSQFLVFLTFQPFCVLKFRAPHRCRGQNRHCSLSWFCHFRREEFQRTRLLLRKSSTRSIRQHRPHCLG